MIKPIYTELTIIDVIGDCFGTELRIKKSTQFDI